MKKNIIKQIAKVSYTRNELDESKVDKIVGYLSRSDLKEYIRYLKNIENRRTVLITLPSEAELPEVKKIFTKLYPTKKIIVRIDPDLITGIKVTDYDNEYEISLKKMLEDSINYITNG